MHLAALFTLYLFLFPCLAGGHVESGPMPDAIAEMEYRILLEFKPDDTLTRNRLAMVLYRLDKLGEAEAELAILLKTAPDDADALDAMGLVRGKQERHFEAIEYFRRSTVANADDRMAWHHLGAALLAVGRLDEAEAALLTAIEKARGRQDEEAALLAAQEIGRAHV